jgi:hypothetical protein
MLGRSGGDDTATPGENAELIAQIRAIKAEIVNAEQTINSLQKQALQLGCS